MPARVAAREAEQLERDKNLFKSVFTWFFSGCKPLRFIAEWPAKSLESASRQHVAAFFQIDMPLQRLAQ
ncbi:hypothetical protein D0N87_35620, partial [Pseudomonas sp. ATCC 13867]